MNFLISATKTTEPTQGLPHKLFLDSKLNPFLVINDDDKIKVNAHHFIEHFCQTFLENLNKRPRFLRP
jgi:hypothetical protein